MANCVRAAVSAARYCVTCAFTTRRWSAAEASAASRLAIELARFVSRWNPLNSCQDRLRLKLELGVSEPKSKPPVQLPGAPWGELPARELLYDAFRVGR